MVGKPFENLIMFRNNQLIVKVLLVFIFACQTELRCQPNTLFVLDHLVQIVQLYDGWKYMLLENINERHLVFGVDIIQEF